MKATNDALIVLSTLENGALKADLSKELTTVLTSLNSLAEGNSKLTLKGSLTLKTEHFNAGWCRDITG